VLSSTGLIATLYQAKINTDTVGQSALSNAVTQGDVTTADMLIA